LHFLSCPIQRANHFFLIRRITSVLQAFLAFFVKIDDSTGCTLVESRRFQAFTGVSPYPLNLFQVRETFLPLFVQNRRESSLWLCSLLFPIVAWRLFPASWGTVSFCSAISIALFQVVVLARVPYNTLFSNCSFNRSTISSSLILYARCFGLRKVRF
jgi:hypothetical protein